MKSTEELAAALIGGAQEAYIEELTYHFLTLFESFAKSGKIKLKGREIADLERLVHLSRKDTMAIFGRYRAKIDHQTRWRVEKFFIKTDDILTGDFIRALGNRRYVTNYAQIIAAQAAQGLTEIIERQNIALAKHQERLWYEVTAEAIARQQSGEPVKAVMERGVRRLSDEGLQTIDYITGTKTTIDAALRRHIVTQANQARNRLLMQRMTEWEWDLVFVDAHFGARPSHALWQGKVYSVSGRSAEYPSLVDVTGYGTVTGLCGANCYHFMTPYVPGLSELPDTDWTNQEKLVGMTSDEYYQATQKQRRYERAIRATKREAAYLESVGINATKACIRLGEQQDRLRRFVADNHLRRDYSRERAWGLKSQPRALKVGPQLLRDAKGITFPGSFSESKTIISAYKASKESVSDTFAKRMGVKLSFSADVPAAFQQQVAAGVESALGFIGDSVRQDYLFRISNSLKPEVLAQASRRECGAVVEVSPALLKKTVNERIQVVFHEVAHAKEWPLTSWEEWQEETDRTLAFKDKKIESLAASRLNQKLEEAFLDNGVLVYYLESAGRMQFDSSEDIELLKSISPYMKTYNDMEDEFGSELLAESFRFVAVHGFGKNKIADIVVRSALLW